MRGISTGSAEYRTDSQVSIYLDDQPLTSISQQADVRLIDIERIESLPGPQGTLFGSSSQAGTLRYVTNKPDFSGFLEQIDDRGRHDQGRRGELRRQRLGQHPDHDNLRCAPSASIGRRRLCRQRPGPDAHRRRDNADIVEDDQNVYRTYGGRIAARWTINPQLEPALTGISSAASTDGHWETDPFLGDHKITRFFDDWRDDEWYTMSLDVTGDLGFAELSVTGPTSTARSTTSGTTRTTTSGAPLQLAAVLRPLRHRHAARGDLQLAEAEPLDLRGPADLAGREPAPVDGGCLLRGRVRLVGLRRPADQATADTRPGKLRRRIRLRHIERPDVAACPLARPTSTTTTSSTTR